MRGVNRAELKRLVEKYRELSPARRKRYNEAQTRKDFIDPLLQALGWDVRGIERDEVLVEERTPAGFPDYTLKIDNIPRVYVEAKPLEDDLYNKKYAEQAITYAYNKGVTWAVLCNFTRVLVFNAEWQTTAVQRARVLDIGWDEFRKQGTELHLLARSAVVERSLEEVAQRFGGMKVRLPVEKSLYQQLRTWRAKLFNAIALFRPDLSIEDVDEVIEKIFNRLIFIRNCEDRNVEEPLLRAALHHHRESEKRSGLTQEVGDVFKKFNGTFDSELFEDHLTDELLQHAGTQFEDVLYDIVSGLYQPPHSVAAYDFAALDADVLGAVYEQYLGYVAKVVKERAKVQEGQLELGLPVERIEVEKKLERRKDQGIYYTPKWVVDYIVSQTVERFLGERTHNDILNLRILDPACGSGSFLIGAFDALLGYHARLAGKRVTELDQFERLKILTANVRGVDIDSQAVEIARLNLLLRAVSKRGLLPSLSEAVVCGNSLISGDEGALRNEFGATLDSKSPVFWQEDFPSTMAAGGFDIIIGNPPYLNEARGNKELFRELKRVPKLAGYYEKNVDLFNFFVELGIDLLKPGGMLGFIIPAYWQNRAGASKLRQKIVSETNIERLVDFGNLKVFTDSLGHHSSIVILRKATQRSAVTNSLRYLQVVDHPSGDSEALLSQTLATLANDSLDDCHYLLSAGKFLVQCDGPDVLSAIKRVPSFTVDARRVVRGVDTSPSDHDGVGVFVLGQREYRDLASRCSRTELSFLKPFFKAGQLDRYRHDAKNSNWLLYTDKTRREQLEENPGEYPALVAHLRQFSNVITSDNKPYGLHRAKKESNFLNSEKILFVRKTPYPKFDLVPEPYFCDESMYLILPSESVDPRYLLAVLNSNVAHYWFLRHKSQGTQLQVDKEIVLSLPIPNRPGSSNAEQQEVYSSILASVDRMLKLRSPRLSGKPSASEIRRAHQLVTRLEEKLNSLVYDLYGLGDGERQALAAAIS
ncbi:MAG: N-6 DNA methylase [Chloroflexi bacterium]|nr:N-6 DNA methylase [Chloroflexota bacterium]